MAVIENISTGEKIVLRSHHVFGRRVAGTDTQINDPCISQIHCAVRWEGNEWFIQDFSRNGTWLDNKRITLHQSYSLDANSVICMAGSEQCSWKIIDLSPPATSLIPVHPKDDDIITLSRFAVLPDETSPEISIYRNESGVWFCETIESTSIMHDGDIIRHGEKMWRFSSADPIDSTKIELTSDEAAEQSVIFDFKVSRDEEHVFLDITVKGKKRSLGERVHHYLLLTLARKREQDSNLGLDPATQGWIDLEDLSSMLGIDRAHLNIQIFRARKQVSHAIEEIDHLPSVFERRSGSIRFGFTQFSITRGSEVEVKLS